MHAKTGGVVVHPDNHRLQGLQVLRKPHSLQSMVLVLLCSDSKVSSSCFAVWQHSLVLDNAQEQQLVRLQRRTMSCRTWGWSSHLRLMPAVMSPYTSTQRISSMNSVFRVQAQCCRTCIAREQCICGACMHARDTAVLHTRRYKCWGANLA